MAGHTRGDLRLYALCGMIAPVFFTLMVVVESYMVSGYNQFSQTISDLGAYALYGSAATLQDVNFWIFGVLILVFALGLRRSFLNSKSIAVTLTLFGAMVFLAGVFPDQPSPYPGGVHDGVSIAAFLAVIACQFLVWNRLRDVPPSGSGGRSRFAAFSLVTGLLSVFLLVAFFVDANSAYAGLVQRVFIAVPLIWLEALALKLFRL